MPKFLPSPRHSIACLGAGLLHALAAGWPSDGSIGTEPSLMHEGLARASWVLQMISLALWVWALQPRNGSRLRARTEAGEGRAHIAQAAVLGLIFGLSWQLATFWWIYIGLHFYGDLSVGLAAVAVGLLGLYLGLYAAVVGALYAARLGRRHAAVERARVTVWVDAAVFGALCLLADLARGVLFTGFNWAAAGHAHVHGPLRAWLPWVGVYGVGALSAFLAALAVGLLKDAPRSWRARGLSLMVLAASVGGTALVADRDFTVSAGEMDVVLLQGNVEQGEKFRKQGVDEAVNWYFQALKSSFADLAIAPETAIPVLEEEIPAAFWDYVRSGGVGHAGALLIGMPQGKRGEVHHNALLGIGHPGTVVTDTRAGSPYRYDKSHLVPFGEFTPTGFAWFTALLDIPLKDFDASTDPPQPLTIRTRSGPIQRVAPVICFEDLYGEELAQRFRDPAQAPTVLANASNMAWFGDSPAIAQHLRIAQIRSLEFQRPTLRATNTGATVVIDHQGRVTRALAPRTRAVLSGWVEGRAGLTPYARWVSRTGLWPCAAAALAVLLCAFRPGRQQASAAGAGDRLPR